jgi:hypothetical protein
MIVIRDDLQCSSPCAVGECQKGFLLVYHDGCMVKHQAPLHQRRCFLLFIGTEKERICQWPRAEALQSDRWIADIDYNMTQELISEFVDLWEQLQES